MLCLLMLCSSFPEILEVDGGTSLGAKAGDTDLDYEIVDRAGERASPSLCSTPSPGLGRRGKFGDLQEAQCLPRGWAQSGGHDLTLNGPLAAPASARGCPLGGFPLSWVPFHVQLSIDAHTHALARSPSLPGPVDPGPPSDGGSGRQPPLLAEASPVGASPPGHCSPDSFLFPLWLIPHVCDVTGPLPFSSQGTLTDSPVSTHAACLPQLWASHTVGA